MLGIRVNRQPPMAVPRGRDAGAVHLRPAMELARVPLMSLAANNLAHRAYSGR
jgi:hypothetical protein